MINYKKSNCLLSLICSLLIFNLSAQNRSSLKNLNKKGVTIDHQAGEYATAINLTIKSKEESINISYNNHVTNIVSGSKALIKINKTGIIYINLKGNDTTYIGTYIIGKKSRIPIISLHLNEALFSDPGGIIFGSKENGVDIGPVWQKKSINTYFEYYDNGSFKCGNDFKIQPFGGWTLGLKEKSLRIIADSNIGPKSIKIDPFENKHFKSFKSLVFRTSGSDQNITRIKDITMASIARDLNLDYQDYRQAILLINGKYWGIYNIREKINKEFLKYNNGAKKSVTTLLKLSGMGNAEYSSMINYIGKDFKNNTVFESINKKIDLENYINYIIFQIHIQNIDSRGNVRFWKSENLDNRWRWIFYDSDLGCFNSSVGFNYLSKRLSPTQSDWYNPTWSTVILRNLIKHEPIRNYFINKYCVLMGSHLSPKNLEKRIDYFAGVIRPEIPQHIMRRNQIYGETLKRWEKNINLLKSFFVLRKPTAYDHIKSCFGLNKPPVLLTIKPSIKGLKTIRLANSDEEWSELTSLFFPDIPLSLEATNLNYLYKFVKWKDQEGNNKLITTYPKENKVIEAIYKHRDYSPNCGKIIVSQWSFKQSYKDTVVLFGIRNISNLSITNEKWKLFSNGEEENITISIKNLSPGDVIYFTNKPKSARKLFNIKDIEKIKIIPGFSNSGGEWVLMDQKDLIIDSIFITIPDSSRIYKKAITLWRDLDTKKWVYDNEPDYPTKGEIYIKSYLWQIIVIILGIIISLLVYYYRNKMMKKNNLLMVLALFINSITFSQKSDQFGLDSINKKLIDNKGKGFDSLIGCRNVRVVLKNLVYRGGNNNPLSVQNPLTLSTINDLNNLGFNDIRYLYSKNFTKYFPKERLDSLRNNGVKYTCMSRLDSMNVFNFFTNVHQKVNANSDSMIYLHCWNGWHQSGWIASLTLMQFCDMDNETALSYWASNTDRNFVGYDHVKKAIKEFKPFPNIFFTEQQKKDYCPCLNKDLLTKEYPLSIVYGDKNSINKTDIKIIPDTLNIKKEKVETKIHNEKKEKEIDHSSKKKKEKQVKEKNNLKYHIVKRGDTLSGIAKKYKISISKICSLNHIKSKDIIRTGQKILIK